VALNAMTSLMSAVAMPNRTAPWKKPKPKQRKRTTLTPQSIARAKAAAKKAGRRYPNLIDNMNAAKKQREAEENKKRRGTDAASNHP